MTKSWIKRHQSLQESFYNPLFSNDFQTLSNGVFDHCSKLSLFSSKAFKSWTFGVCLLRASMIFVCRFLRSRRTSILALLASSSSLNDFISSSSFLLLIGYINIKEHNFSFVVYLLFKISKKWEKVSGIWRSWSSSVWSSKAVKVLCQMRNKVVVNLSVFYYLKHLKKLRLLSWVVQVFHSIDYDGQNLITALKPMHQCIVY